MSDTGERLCPVCRGVLEKGTRHGVEVDVCDEHGLWLDKGELGRIQLNKFLEDTPKRRVRLGRFRRRVEREMPRRGWDL